MTAAVDFRRRDLARIHLLAKELGLSDAEYRDTLWTLCRVHSAADLDTHGRRTVISHLNARRAPLPVQEPPEKARLLWRIRQLLQQASRPEAYADAMARRMFQVERLTWCEPDQLRRILSALFYDARRRRPV